MYLTAVDLSWEGECSHSDPDREEEETRDSGMIFFFCPTWWGQGPLPCPGTCKARVWGQIWPTFGNTDKPSPGTEPLPRVRWTERQMTGTGTRTLALTRSLGSFRTLLCFGDSLHMLHAHLAPRGSAWKIQEPGRPSLLSPASELPRRPLADGPAKRRDTLLEEAAHDSSPSWDSPSSSSCSPSWGVA